MLQSARRSARTGAARRSTRSRASSSATSAATPASACRRASTATRASAPATTTGRPSAAAPSAREKTFSTQTLLARCRLILAWPSGQRQLWLPIHYIHTVVKMYIWAIHCCTPERFQRGDANHADAAVSLPRNSLGLINLIEICQSRATFLSDPAAAREHDTDDANSRQICPRTGSRSRPRATSRERSACERIACDAGL